MDIKKAEQMAKETRASAKRMGHSLFKVPPGISNITIDKLIDDIISAAILEITIIHANSIDDLKEGD